MVDIVARIVACQYNACCMEGFRDSLYFYGKQNCIRRLIIKSAVESEKSH